MNRLRTWNYSLFYNEPFEVPFHGGCRSGGTGAARFTGNSISAERRFASAPSGARGVFSSNFKPAPRKGKADGFIPSELQTFRLATGAPLYVDFKCIPYQDAEVLDWYRRVLWCQDIYANRASPGEDVRAQLLRSGITHVVAPAANDVPFARLGAPVYEDEAYRVYRVAKN